MSDFEKALADVRGFLLGDEKKATSNVTISPEQIELVLRALSLELKARGIDISYWVGSETLGRIQESVLERLQRGDL